MTMIITGDQCLIMACLMHRRRSPITGNLTHKALPSYFQGTLNTIGRNWQDNLDTRPGGASELTLDSVTVYRIVGIQSIVMACINVHWIP